MTHAPVSAVVGSGASRLPATGPLAAARLYAAAVARRGRRACAVFVAGLVWLLAPAGAEATADAPPLVLEHLTTTDGLPQGTVMSTLQDSQGFVWLGTQDGLVRFDGHELVRYAYSRNARGGLPGNFIYQIIEDAHHDLWIAIPDAGVARWNRASDTFTVFRHEPGNPSSLGSNAVRTVLLDAAGRVWVGTSDAGIDVLDPVSGRAEHLRHDPARADSLIDDRIYTLALDRGGQLWIGTEVGLDRWQPGERSFAHYRHVEADPHSLSGTQVSQIVEDQGGTVWVATSDGGLNRMDGTGRVSESFRHDPRRPTSLASDDVRAVLEDQAGHLWVGTADGLDLLDRASGRFTHYRHDERDAGSLRDSFVMSLYEDATGLVWIGTRAGGVSRWNPHSWELGGHRPGWLETRLVTAFADAPNGRVWIASLGGGLALLDGGSGETTGIDEIVGRRNALGDSRVMSLRQDRRGTLWIGTMTKGLVTLAANGRIRALPVQPGDARSLSAAGIMTIFEARDGRLWIGTHGGGANVIDPATGAVRQLPYGPAPAGAVSAPSVTAIAEDPSGDFWIGTEGGGLDLARSDGTVIRVFRHDPSDPTTLPANTVYALTVDAQGRVWVGTDGGGLARVVGSAASAASIRFDVVSRDDGLSSDTIYGVLGDDQGRLWLSGNAGLMRYDPDSRAVKTYHREHGLQGEEFDFGAFHRLRDGRLCFGGPGGFNIFSPARLFENKRPPRLALTRLEVLGVPAPGAKPYWLLDRIAIDHRASILSLDFGVLDFTSPKRNRLAYRMAGLTDRWIDLGTQRRITLTNLDAGDHVLEVRAANADSVWSTAPLRLTIRRDPAPWKSPWAYAAYLLTALGLFGYRLRLQRLKFRRVVEARERLEAEVDVRTRELTESNRQLAEAVQAKSSFLDRMSHELRTPMNGVVGMTELLARTPLSATQARLTQTIRSSAQILLQIVNDLLDLSKIQAGKVELESVPIDLARLLEECTTLFAGAAEAKGLELIVCPPASPDQALRGDPLRIRQILMNLIGNAVKFTAQGEIVVRADVSPATTGGVMIDLTVADTGIGMDEATLAKIFEPFTQGDESTSRRFGGSGLGLAICRELAGVLGGTITADSRPGIGSTFHVSLPVQVQAEPPSRAPRDWALRRAYVRTRRPALAESLGRQLAALGLVVVADDRREPTVAAGPGDVVLVDASSEQACLQAIAAAPPATRPKLLIVATSAEVEAQRLERLVGAEAIVTKPVQRDALDVALSAAIGRPVPAATGEPPPIPGAPVGGGHVLLVEDEPVNAAVAQGYLAALGCTSIWVEDGSQAVARSSAERFDLILMDLSMPVMDGFATTALIRQREGAARHTPIIALTAHEASSYRDACLTAGMDDVLSKPYTLDECARLVGRWLRHAGAVPSDSAPSALLDPRSSVDAAAVAGLRSMRTGGAPDLYSRLVDLFRTGSTAALADLQAALAAGDLARADAGCHKLTSSAANVGALVFASDVRQLGQLCRAGDAAGARSLLAALVAAHPALIDGLMRLRLQASA